MTTISISKEIKEKVPEIRLSCIECDVYVLETNDLLWDEIRKKTDELSADLKTDQISKIPAIAASRKAYKACGKDPARYRLSAEALLRRVVKNKGLYQVNNVVDVLNLVSITSGFSIGGYDCEKIKGEVELGIGTAADPYEGIGRGRMNIEFLPTFRDEKGAFGTPTSDSERTAVSTATKRFLMVIIDFGEGDLDAATKLATDYLERFAFGRNFKIKTIK
ncbi:MAG: phenylalanine--tRNA ligase beta subunit-related protein [Mariniphaga sp.]|jgi:DNA/RNA-binding domain of Phe-tRNA-synthetase-like protein|nr:phenylalanine--tRNA ligase beta subunit-related protein [Mariniphaga sp.]